MTAAGHYDRTGLIPTSAHPHVRNGAVYDMVEAGGVVLTRIREGIAAREPSLMRLQATRPLSDADIARYCAAAARAGSGRPVRDTPYSFVIATGALGAGPGLPLDVGYELYFDDVRETPISPARGGG